MTAEAMPLTAEILACLDAVGRCLCAGDLAGLGAMTARLDELDRGLGVNPTIPPADLAMLKSRAERQLALVGAAREGVQAALRRVALLHSVSGELSTYDRDGHGRTVRFGSQNLEQRA